jgi:WXG100 family type VII secretion target
MADSFPPPVTAAISAAYKVNAGLGAQVKLAAEESWGDPQAIKALAQSWTALATHVDNTGKDLQREIRSLGQDWEGGAADAYKNWMQTLNDESIQVLSGQFKQISSILDGAAGDVSAMNEEFTKLCTWFAATVLAAIAASKTGTIGALAVVGASIKFADKLIEFQNSYLEKLNPRTQALRQISTGIQNGSIGRRVQHSPDLEHPFPYFTQEFADPYQWNVLGDWRNWKLHN